MTPAEIHRQLRSGPLRVGIGTFGNGFYMAESRTHAKAYGDKTPESVGRYGLRSDAKVIRWPALLAEMDAYANEHPEMRDWRSVESRAYGDPGRFAMARGYDAIEIHKGERPGIGAEAAGNQWVILNRTALVSEVHHNESGAVAPSGPGVGPASGDHAGASAGHSGGGAGGRLGSTAAGHQGTAGADRTTLDHASTLTALKAAPSRADAEKLLKAHRKADLQGLADHAGVPYTPRTTVATLRSAILDEAGHGAEEAAAPAATTPQFVDELAARSPSDLRKLAKMTGAYVDNARSPSDLAHAIYANAQRRWHVSGEPLDRGRMEEELQLMLREIDAAKTAKKAAKRHVDLQLAGVELRALGHDTHPGDPERLKEYWLEGKGAGLWVAAPDPWTELYHHLLKYMPIGEAKRTAAQWFHDHFGFWPGADLNRVTHGKPPRGHRVGPG
jgi:hypothetical protein